MKAVRMYAPGDLRVENIPIPVVADDEVLIKIMAVGVCGSDIPRANVYGAHISPIVLGHEFSGIIEKTGRHVTRFNVNDRVTVPPLIPCYHCEWCLKGQYSLCDHYDYYGSRRDGAMAQYIAVKETNLLKVGDPVSYEDAATTDPCANALHAMARAGFLPGETVCVSGAGPIGLFAIQYARIKGAGKIIAVDIWEEKLEMAKQVGADVVIQSRSGQVPDRVKAATGGAGADIVIDFSGAPAAQLDCLRSAAKMGRVVLLGISHQGLNLSEHDVDIIMREQLDIRGSWNSFTAPFPGSDWTDSIDLYENHGMTAKNIISHRLELDDVPEIFKNIAKGDFLFSKIMFFPWGVV